MIIAGMISVRQADKTFQQHVQLQPKTTLPVRRALGEVLRTDITARQPIPSFDRVMMDGIAVRFAQVQKGQTAFPVQGIQKAGEPPKTLLADNACLEVMTGAPLPVNCDCVIPYEETERLASARKLLRPQALSAGQHIHPKGCDAPKGGKILSQMTRLGPVQLAILAAQGYQTVAVSQRPRISVITTGDELVRTQLSQPGYKIYASNDHSLAAALQQSGFKEVRIKHVPDHPKTIHNTLAAALDKHDVLIISGGVSKGRYDYIPEVLKELRVQAVFHRVKQKPGKPLWFGRKKNKFVFGLPGNPVSVLVCFYRFVLPFLHQSLGLPAPEKWTVTLGQDVSFAAPLTLFQPVEVRQQKKDGTVWAKPVKISCSGDFVRLNTAQGFIELPAAKKIFKKGERFAFTPWSYPA